MGEWASLLKIGIALFTIVNPIGGIPIFITATNGWSKPDRTKAIRTIGLTVFCVLVLSIFVGDQILAFFDISIPSFQAGGGILLLLMAISMMHGHRSAQAAEAEHFSADRDAIAIVPLSIPLLAGPGAISSMIIAAEQSNGFLGHIWLIVPVAIVSLLVWGILMLSFAIASRLGTIGINIVTRLMGLILAAMAIEFIAHGLGSLFPGLLK